MIQHIKQLFEETKTIILPGLGALTITNPDSGELMFMPYLKHDDGVLSKYIANKEGISEDDAKEKIKAEVERIVSDVETGKTVSFGDFGQFISELGDIAFENKSDDKSEVIAPEKKNEEPIVAPTVVETPKNEAPEPVQEPKKEVEEKPQVIATPEEKPLEPEPIQVADSKKKEDTAPVEEKPVKTEATKTLADEIEESEKDLPKAAKAETKTPVTEKPVEEKKVTPSNSNKTIAEEIAEAETTKSKVVAPASTKPDSPKKEMNILEKEEVAANQKKLEKLRKEKETTKQKKKRGVGFYILMVLIVLLIGGGTYVGLNYDQVKEYIPFLSDNKTPKNKGDKEVDKMQELIGEEPTTNQESSSEMDSTTLETPPTEEIQEETIEPPVVVEKPEVKPTKKPISTSNNQPYHIVAGVFSSPENAERLAKKISDMGYPAKTFARGSQTVVSVQSFATQAEAQSALSSTKDAAPSGWILKWNQ